MQWQLRVYSVTRWSSVKRQETCGLSITQTSGKGCRACRKAIGACTLHIHLPHVSWATDLLFYEDARKGHEQLCLLIELSEQRCRRTCRVAAQEQVRENCILAAIGTFSLKDNGLQQHEHPPHALARNVI